MRRLNSGVGVFLFLVRLQTYKKSETPAIGLDDICPTCLVADSVASSFCRANATSITRIPRALTASSSIFGSEKSSSKCFRDIFYREVRNVTAELQQLLASCSG